MSAFDIDRTQYISHPDRDCDERSMNVKLGKALENGMKFRHEYDFGSTTVLMLKIVSERVGIKRRNKIELMARNILPEIKCAVCGGKATQLCTECMWDSEGEAELCDDCAAEHECGEEMLLPICNSPRCGVCGYEGGVYEED